MEKRTLIIIIIVAGVLCILALVLGLVFGLKKYDEDNQKEVVVMNSYENTDELIKKFPVTYSTTVKEDIEKDIQNRLLTGFENWNRGFETWKAWGNILYTNESIYNVHGTRLSLASYQKSMDITLKRETILMGDFHNMLITDEFTGIHYDIYTGAQKKKSTVMEFVKFKYYGRALGTRVVEGWGSTKDESGEDLVYFQADKEKAKQKEQDNYIKSYEIPTTSDLKEKYKIINPTTYIDDNAEDILQILLDGFDKWNEGIGSFKNWIDDHYVSNAISTYNDKSRTLDEYKAKLDELFDQKTIEKLYFDNVLIRDNWAGLHYRYRIKNNAGEVKDFGDRMEFLHFNDELKITGSWIK